jgi:hypothetical protein
MIGVTSEYLANIMDYKETILFREKASFIVELYNSMSNEDMRRKEDHLKWVYKLVKQADLDRIANNHREPNADGRRSTKQDIERLKVENAKLYSRLELLEKEIKKESGELKTSLGRMEKENKVALETIISLISSTRTP